MPLCGFCTYPAHASPTRRGGDDYVRQRWPWLTAIQLAEFFFRLQFAEDLTLGGTVDEGSWFHQRLCELQRLGHGSKQQQQAFQALRKRIAKGIQQSGDEYVADDEDVEALLQVLAELS